MAVGQIYFIPFPCPIRTQNIQFRVQFRGGEVQPPHFLTVPRSGGPSVGGSFTRVGGKRAFAFHV